jgi:hypothetical protein
MWGAELFHSGLSPDKAYIAGTDSIDQIIAIGAQQEHSLPLDLVWQIVVHSRPGTFGGIEDLQLRPLAIYRVKACVQATVGRKCATG